MHEPASKEGPEGLSSIFFRRDVPKFAKVSGDRSCRANHVNAIGLPTSSILAPFSS